MLAEEEDLDGGNNFSEGDIFLSVSNLMLLHRVAALLLLARILLLRLLKELLSNDEVLLNTLSVY